MKKLILLSSLLILATLPVHAEESKTLRETRIENRQEIRNEIQENRQETRELRIENRQEVRSMVAENHASRLERRFGLYASRFESIINRFKQRLDSLNPNDPKVAELESDIADITAKLSLAKTKGTDAVKAFRAIDPAKFAEQKTEAVAARDLAVEARNLFKEVHSMLKDALKDLKSLSKPALPAASAAVSNAQ